MLKVYKVDQAHWVAPIVVSLKGTASYWYQACELENDGVELTWLEFEKAFEERWYEDDKQKFARARQLIENWKWNGDYERFYSTYDQIRALVKKKDYPENLLIEEYEKGIPSHLRQSYHFGAHDIPSKRKVFLEYVKSVNAIPDGDCDTE